MTHLHLHLRECGIVSEDREGMDVADIDAARARAIDAARDIMAAEVRGGRLCLTCCIDIAEADGRVLDTVWFADVLVVTGQDRTVHR